MRHPIQPLAIDEKGVLRFKRNAIVSFLLDNGGFDMNKLAGMDFSNEDREQFAQLIGYSHSGFGELSYVSDETYKAAAKIFEEGKTDTLVRLEEAERQLAGLRSALRNPMAELFRVHPDDLKL